MLQGRALVWLTASLTGIGACASAPASSPQPAGATPASRPATPPASSLTATQVADATIENVFATPITLAAGRYEGPPLVAGGAARPTAVLLTPLVALGDLDDAPGTDAAALIAANEGGSGERVYLSIVGARAGRATSVATLLVGDRTRVRDLRLSGRDIVLDVVEIGPGEAACCGTQMATRTYRLDGTALREVSAQVTGRMSIDVLGGTTWEAVEIDGTALPSAAKPPTLEYQAANGGRIAGFTGCNRYTAPIAESAPGTVTIGPAVSTRRACVGDGMQVEATFLAALGKVTRYAFVGGRLHLSGPDGDRMRTIVFARSGRTR